MSEAKWHIVAAVADIEQEGVIRVDIGDQTFAIYHTASGFYATDGICTHDYAHLADGLVMGEIIECPMHQGRFHIPSGRAELEPACIDLQTYPIKVENYNVYIQLSA